MSSLPQLGKTAEVHGYGNASETRQPKVKVLFQCKRRYGKSLVLYKTETSKEHRPHKKIEIITIHSVISIYSTCTR